MPLDKIALISANFGSMDQRRVVPKQSVPCDVFYFDEGNSPFPFPNLCDRLKAKYFKIQSHRVPQLAGYDYYVWIDASVQIKSPDFVKDIRQALSCGDIAIGAHPARNCCYAELDYIQAHVKRGSQYLSARYANQALDKEAAHYKSIGHPVNAGLYACGIWARANNTKVNRAFDDWWDLCLAFSYSDQAAFAVAMRRNGITIMPFNYGSLVNNDYFTRKPHTRIQ